MSEYKMPSLGADMEDAVLLEWKVKEGDYVNKGDIIAEIETVKGDIEVEVFEEGMIQKLYAKVGEKIPVGTVLAYINATENYSPIEVPSPFQEPSITPTPPEISPMPQSPAEPERIEIQPFEEPGEKPIPVEVPPGDKPLEEPLPIEVPRREEPGEKPIPVDVPPPKEPTPEKEPPEEVPPIEEPPTKEPVDVAVKKRARASPLARKIAEDLHLDLSKIKGSGEGGIIHKVDVQQYAAALKNKPQEVTANLRNEKMRSAIATAMSLSNQEIPHYYLETSIDLSKAMEWLKNENLRLPVQQRILPAVLLLKAMAKALTHVPDLNGYWKEGRHYLKEDINIGFAISLRGGGLVIPAFHRVHQKSLSELMENLTDVTERARTGKLRSSELTDGTITMTNIGDRGVENVFGVIYPPQVAIVGFGKVMEKPWADEGMLDVRPVVVATLAADHRATDGRVGAKFLDQLGKFLQAPEKL